jgi:hypothetical protein
MNPTGVSVQALWRVEGYIQGPDATMPPAEILAYQGRQLDMDDTSITFAGKTCTGITFNRHRTDTPTYFSEKLHIHQDDISYPSPTIGVIRTNCALEGFAEFIRLDDRRLLVTVQGVIFILMPNIIY